MNEQNREQADKFSIRGRVVAGVVLIGAMVVMSAGWAAKAQLSGAVVLGGEVAVDRNLRVVQHRDGGIVQTILVQDGAEVQAGDMLIKLDDTAPSSERAIVHGKIVEYSIRKARLEAQRDFQGGFAMPAGLDLLIAPKAVREEIYAGEKRIFDGSMASFRSRKEQLELGIMQVQAEIEGLEARLAAKSEEIELVAIEDDRITDLSDRNLAVRNAVFSIGREKVRLRGEMGDIQSAIGRARSRINELELDILSIEEKLRTDSQRELREIDTMLSELNERRLVVEDTLKRTEIRAPVSGQINELNVNSVGGVITPAEILATIVPDDATLVFAARVPSVQIEQVTVGSPARLRFTAFERNITPEIEGHVSYVAAAATRDPATGADYYAIRLEVPQEDLALLGDRKLRPGMPLELYVTTTERTALSYLVKPFQDQLARAFRER